MMVEIMIHYRKLARVMLPLMMIVGYSACDSVETPVLDTELLGNATFEERYRPQFHYTPPFNWMNDPNGMFYYDGKYFLHHQYNPHGNTWGHMSWYQAVSSDLVHWEHTGVVIPEEGNEMIFSGGAIVDYQNTSGFAQDGQTPIIATYSSHYTYTEEEVGEGEPTFEQAQSLAYSLDGGRTFRKYEGNPVLNHEDPDFRDPNVMWHDESSQWVMVVALPIQRKVAFYGSPNLRQWEHLSDFGPSGGVEGIWECPDLFELSIDGDPTNTRWVLHVDMNPGAIAGGSGSQYFIGDFDGTHFTLDSQFTEDDILWTDYGTDFYAAISWSDVPEEDGRRLWLGWMSNWKYANIKPTTPWRSAMSIPRTVELSTVDGSLRLIQKPVDELQKLRSGHRHVENIIINGTVSLEDFEIKGKSYEMKLTLDAGTADDFGVKVRTGGDEQTRIGYDTGSETLYVDRTLSGEVDFHERFATISEAPLQLNDGSLELHILVDWSSVEVFADGGRKVFTTRIFPNSDSQGIALYSEGGEATLNDLDFWSLNSIWEQVKNRVTE